MSDHDLEVWKNWKQAQQKYDYFVIGLSAALFAYIGGKYSPEALSISQNSFELLALLSFFLSIASGIFRIENDLSIQATKIKQLNAQKKLKIVNQLVSTPGQIMNIDEGKEMSQEELLHKQDILRKFISSSDNDLEFFDNRCTRQFLVRNFSLLFGFLFLIISKFISFILMV